ncbi:MAG: sensor histidine kinase [Caulobacteraceae bacterium]
MPILAEASSIHDERLRRALEASRFVGLWDWDLSSGLVVADERFARLYGVDPEVAAQGAPLSDYVQRIHEDDRTRFEADVENALREGGELQTEYRLLQPGGEVRWVLASGKVLRDEDGRATHFPGAAVDITERKQMETDLFISEAKFRAIADTMPQMVWSTLPDGFHDYYNRRWYEFTGMADGSTDGEGWNGMFHPDDQERAWTLWRHSLETGEPYEVEYRLRHHSGEYRWTLGRALPIRDAKGRITRWFGTCTDIHETKKGAEQQELLGRELSHRIKNIFSVITGLISLAVRNHPEAAGFAAHLRGRIQALGRAHDFVRPHSEQSNPCKGEATLYGMLGQLVLPYGEIGERIILNGEDPLIDDRSATPLALIFHELATNAAKYGALSTPEGRVTVEGYSDGGLHRMTWTETGGPAVAEAPAEQGFGTTLTRVSAEGQLGGTVTRYWNPEGLRVELAIPVTSMSRTPQPERLTVNA